MTMMASGPMFEPAASTFWRGIFRKDGAHYNIYEFRSMDALREMFPDGGANSVNFVLFSTSGVHGTYVTIEEIEAGIRKYGDAPSFPDDEWPDDYYGNDLTVLIVQPRIVCLRYGSVPVTLADIEYLKKLRQTSWDAVLKIGVR